ncbi:MAG: hypothetical protein PHR45_03600 [Muribaculaceae bacterium]|nr:hypothetical protein [Muribaculaceae bacterium]
MHTTVIAIIIFAAISWLYFCPAVTDGKVLQQHDVQQGVAIGQEVKAFTEATGETSRWTNSLFSGMPNFQISPSYQSSKLISWISNAYSLWFPSPVNLLFIMMLGFYILMLALKVRWYLAILGAVAYAFSTYFFIIIGAGHIWKYITLAYIPPTIAGIIWAYRGRFFTGSVIAALFATLQIASNHVQMSYYFLFVIIALAVAFLAIAIKNHKIKEWGISTGALVVAAIIAVATNSPNLYNTYEYSKETMRGGHSELTKAASTDNASANGLDKSYITAWSYGIDETFSLIVPNINGGASIKPEKGENIPMVLSDTETAKEMFNTGEIQPADYQNLRSFFQYFGDQPMTNGPVYVGALIFVFFILGCIIVKGPIKWALLATTILSILLSWGHNFMWLTDLFIDYFPMYNKFRTVSSILVIAEFTIPVLAILALQKIFSSKSIIKQYQKPILISFGIGAIICITLILAPSIIIGDAYSQPEADTYIAQGIASQYPTLFNAVEKVRFGMVSSDALRSLIIILAAFGVLVLFSIKKISKPIACVILSVIIVADLFSVNKRYINDDSFTTPHFTENAKFTPRPADNYILQDTTMNYRVLDIARFDEAMPSYFHKTIGGYHAAKLSRYQDIIDRHIQISRDGININPAVLDMLNAKYVIFNDTVAEINVGALGNAWLVDNIKFVNSADEEIDALASLNPSTTAVSDKKFKSILDGKIAPKQATDTIFETSYAPNRLTYHANSANGGLAVFSEVYFPWGWNATIDGEPVEIGRVNYILRAIKIPAGQHSIQFCFEPRSIKVTETIAYAAIAILYLSIIASIVAAMIQRKKHKDSIRINE